MVYKAEEIAKIFAHKAKQDGEEVTHKKLQKLLYYAQAWNLVINKEKLFSEKIEAWVHGPVVPVVYNKFKSFGHNSFVISDDAIIPAVNSKSQKVIDSVWKTYGKYDGNYLEILTHNEDPWKNARSGLGDFDSSNTVISPKSMKEYYGRKLKEAKKKSRS